MTRHTCGGPVFGRLAPTGTCPRCDELRKGAEPVRWRSASHRDPSRADAIAEHYRSGECARTCGPVCTRFDW